MELKKEMDRNQVFRLPDGAHMKLNTSKETVFIRLISSRGPTLSCFNRNLHSSWTQDRDHTMKSTSWLELVFSYLKLYLQMRRKIQEKYNETKITPPKQPQNKPEAKTNS